MCFLNKVYITAYSVISALGAGNDETYKSLSENKKGIYFPDKSEKFQKLFFPINYDFNINNDITLSAKLALTLLSFIEKNWLELSPIPIFMATSTGGIKETEEVYKHLRSSNKKYNLGEKYYFYDIFNSIKEKYKDKIPEAYTFSTACSASGHSIFHAYRYIKNGIIDKAIVLGIDALSITTNFGFDSLKLVSEKGTRPLTLDRDGLSLGEGGAIILLESKPSAKPIAEIAGIASNSDGYHITSPNPEGIQQRTCINNSIKEAGITPDDIDYINAHGTGTPTNDEIEINVIKSIFTNKPPVTSLKGFIGHTVGSSAIIELAICLEMLKHKKIFQQENMNNPIDEELIPKTTIEKNVKYFLKNSFGFGGNNVSMVIKTLFQEGPL